MENLKWVSDNGMIIEFVSPFFFKDPDMNSGGVSFEEIKVPGIDGIKTIDRSYNGKILRVNGNIVGEGPNQLEFLKNELSLAMNSNYDGWLYAYQYDGSIQKKRCMPNQLPDYKDGPGLQVAFTLEWKSDDPYWLDTRETILTMGQVEPLWSFPFCTPVIFGNCVAKKTMRNSSGVDIFPIIEIQSPMDKVLIVNKSTGQILEVDKEIPKGKKLIIDNMNCEIELVDIKTGFSENATNELVAGREFITLKPGENFIELQNPVKSDRAIVHIKYHKPRLAV